MSYDRCYPLRGSSLPLMGRRYDFYHASWKGASGHPFGMDYACLDSDIARHFEVYPARDDQPAAAGR